MLRTPSLAVLFLTCLHLSPPVFSQDKPAFTNLAASAKITASSVMDEEKYAAANIADGRIAPALSQLFAVVLKPHPAELAVGPIGHHRYRLGIVAC